MTADNASGPAATTTISVDSLFRPIKFGGAELKNRIVLAPMTRNFSPGGVPGENVADYYKRFVEGGVGLVITEGTEVNHKGASAYPNVPHFFGEEALAGWKRVVDEVHAVGGVIIPQLWHVGSIRQPKEGEVPSFGPSAVMHPSFNGKGITPVEMTQDDIDDVVRAFAAGARDAKAIGMVGIEIHGAHSYMIDQFFWEVTNQRTDKYGGDIAARTRFAVEIIEACRAAVGPEFPIVFRFSQWKQGDYNHKMVNNPEEYESFLKPLVAAGADYLHASTRRFSTPEFEGSDLNLAGWAQKITGVPTMTVGSVGLNDDFLHMYAGTDAEATGIDALIERMDAGEFEFVAVGRALLGDANWVNKVREGREGDIRLFQREMLASLEANA